MWHFLQELRRRKVLRVGIAYVVSSWVLLQVADLFSSILDLPDWSTKLVLLVLVIGFIPALILSWAYDLTPHGINVTPAPDNITPAGNKFHIIFEIVIIIAVLAVGGWWYSGKSTRWAHNEAIREIDSYVESGNLEAAYALALQVEEVIPNDPDLAELWDAFTWTTSIQSTPAGATVYRRPYSDQEAPWQELGTTPLYDIHIPHGLVLLRMEKAHHEPLLRAIGGGLQHVKLLPVEQRPTAGFGNINPENYKLYSEGSVPEGMVAVPAWDALIDGELVRFRDFFMGRYEVTNSEYQQFINGGGYRRRDFWEHEFVQDGETISFEKAMESFVDKTGRAGPSTWEAGSYKEGEGDFPVAGISWYEAAAYARFAGRELPTIHHWRRGIALGMLAWQLPSSNLERDRIAAVGEFAGIGWTGTYDMAGNVREWCLNATNDGQRVIVGGAWNDAPYMVEESISAPARRDAMDRSSINGLRLVSTNEELATMRIALKPVVDEEPLQLADPVSEEVFAERMGNFDYDPSPLNPVVEETKDFRHWTRQLISIDSPVSGERIPLYLYLPEHESSRHQVVLFWPGGAPQFLNSIEQSRLPLDFVIRNGRAVAYPILKGMFDRRVIPRPDWKTHAGRDLVVEQVREFRRVIDYLETRPDIERDKIGYYGHSWGGRMGAIVAAVEPRIKVAVLNQAGINAGDHPDINVIHFLPRVRIPVLQFNGLYDSDFRFETSSKPFFERLGTDPADKKHVVEPTGHFVPPAIAKGETLDWFDRYLGGG